MKTARVRREGDGVGHGRSQNVPGIVITDGGLGLRTELQPPRVRAFIYGERLPSTPILPFGRWKQGS